MKELIEKVDKDVPTVDHLKKMAEAMFEGMKAVLKDDYEDEIIRISKSVGKILVDLIDNNKPKQKPAVKSSSSKGGKKEKEVEEEEEEEEEPKAKVKETKKGREGKKEKEKSKEKEEEEEVEEMKEKVKDTKKGRERKKEKEKKERVAVEDKSINEEKEKKKEKEEQKEREGKKEKEEKKEKAKKQPAAKAKQVSKQKDKKEIAKSPEQETEAKSTGSESEVQPGDIKCKMCKGELAPPMYQCVDHHVICHMCLHGSERGYCPTCRKETGKNRRPKKHDKWSTLLKADSDVVKMEVDQVDVVEPLKLAFDEDKKVVDEDKKVVQEDKKVVEGDKKVVEGDKKVVEDLPTKMEVDEKEAEPELEPAAQKIDPPVLAPIPVAVQVPAPVQNNVVVASAPQLPTTTAAAAVTPPQPKARKRKGKNAESAEGETKEKTKKVAAAPKAKRLTKAEKKLLEAASKTDVTQHKIDENIHPPKLETLLSSAAPANLPKSVLLPTSPIVQNLLPKSPQPQVAAVQAFQLRPTTGVPSAPGSPPQFRMQGSSPQQQPPVRPHGLQFFKIVEGKPVQIGAPASTSGIQPALPTSPLPMQPNAAAGPGPKLLYVRNPLPASTAPSSSLSPTRPQLAQKQIILLSNKGPGKAHILTPVSPTNSQGGLVKLVSTGGGNGDGGKLGLGSNVARVAPQLQGPVLLRPVGPLPSPPLPQPQLPSVPLPRAALSTAPGPVVDKAQALLPKSPLPPAQIKSTPLMKIPGGPTQVPTGPATTSTAPSLSSGSTSASPKSDSSVINKAFVWKNSDKTQFKLSARYLTSFMLTL